MTTTEFAAWLARLVLVDGLTQAEAATRLGATQQAAYNAVQRVRDGLDLARRVVWQVTASVSASLVSSGTLT